MKHLDNKWKQNLVLITLFYIFRMKHLDNKWKKNTNELLKVCPTDDVNIAILSILGLKKSCLMTICQMFFFLNCHNVVTRVQTWRCIKYFRQQKVGFEKMSKYADMCSNVFTQDCIC